MRARTTDTTSGKKSRSSLPALVYRLFCEGPWDTHRIAAHLGIPESDVLIMLHEGRRQARQ